MKQFFIVSTLMMASCLQVGAETLTVEQGVVRINQGQGFRLVRGTVDANVGDLVKVDVKGKAKLVSSCAELDLKPGITRVGDRCASPRGVGAPVEVEQGAQLNPLYVATALAVAGGIAGGTVAATSGGGNSGPIFLAPLAQNPVSR